MTKKINRIILIVTLIVLSIILFKGCNNNETPIVILKNTEKKVENYQTPIETIYVEVLDTIIIKEYIYEDKIIYQDNTSENEPIIIIDTIFIEKELGNPIYPIQVKELPNLNYHGLKNTPLLKNTYGNEELPFHRKILIGPSSNFNLNELNYMGIDLLYRNSEKTSLRLGLGSDINPNGSRQPFISWGFYYELGFD